MGRYPVFELFDKVENPPDRERPVGFPPKMVGPEAGIENQSGCVCFFELTKGIDI